MKNTKNIKHENNESGLSKATIVIVVISSLACLALLGYDVWNTKYLNAKLVEQLKQDRMKMDEIERFMNVSLTDPLSVFKRFFKSPEERERFSIMYEKQRNVTHKTRPATSNCYFKCSDPTKQGEYVRKRRESPLSEAKMSRSKRRAKAAIYHGCCTSIRTEVSPTEGKNLQGIERRIVQMKGSRQFFVTESCLPQTGCRGCTCGQPDNFVYEAVVYIGNTSNNDATNMEIDHIVMKGCCKCLNF